MKYKKLHARTDFAARLERLLKARRIKKNALARKLGMPASALTRWTRGLSWPRVEMILALSSALGVSAEWILTGGGAGPGPAGEPGPIDRARHEFPLRLTRLMESRGLSQSELAANLKVSRQLVSQWLHARGIPSRALAGRLARILGVTSSELGAGARGLARGAGEIEDMIAQIRKDPELASEMKKYCDYLLSRKGGRK